MISFRQIASRGIAISQIAGGVSLFGGLIDGSWRGLRYPLFYFILAQSVVLLALFAGVQLFRGRYAGYVASMYVQGIQILQVFTAKVVFAVIVGLHGGFVFGSNFMTTRIGFNGQVHAGINLPTEQVLGVNLIALIALIHLRYFASREPKTGESESDIGKRAGRL